MSVLETGKRTPQALQDLRESWVRIRVHPLLPLWVWFPLPPPSSSSSFVTYCSQGRAWVCCAHAGLNSFKTEEGTRMLGAGYVWHFGLCDFIAPSLSSPFPSTGLCRPITPPFSLSQPQCLAGCARCVNARGVLNAQSISTS